jgi:catechol 2,3-dioxygenase-like lactoylglutathione lyase family enzyme
VKLTFIYQPIADLGGAVAFYRDQLGFDEAWRESDETVAFWLPDRSAQIMLTTTDTGPAGPMYLVDSVDGWMQDHSGVAVSIEKIEIPGGSVAGFAAPGGHTFYVFDQPNA